MRTTPATRRRLSVLILIGSVLVAACWIGSTVAYLPPLDLTAANARSTIVLDRAGTLLRPFATADGRWRLPLEPAATDPRFLAMLTAYEDRRFRDHPGSMRGHSCAPPGSGSRRGGSCRGPRPCRCRWRA